MLRSFLFVTSLSALFICSCTEQRSESLKDTLPVYPDPVAVNVDSTIDPSADFFSWCNGGWFKKNPIPSSESGWGIGKLVQEEIYTRLRKINDDAARANAQPGTDTRKIGDFWSTGMDSAKAQKLGIAPLQTQLNEIDAIKTADDAVQLMSAYEPLGLGLFYAGFYVTQDPKNSEKMTVMLWQGGLGLPDRDYYFNSDSHTVNIRAKYVTYMEKMLKLSGQKDDASKLAGGVMKFETALAKVSRKLEALRDPYANYNKMAVADVKKKLTPSIDWAAVCEKQKVKGVDSIIVGQPEFFSGMNNTLKATDINVLKAYLKLHLIGSFAEYLSPEIDQEQFNFYGKELNGQKEQRPRWKRVLDAEEDAMGMVLGKLFVAEYFPEKTKKRYADLVESIRTVYAERISALTWMTDSTKKKAQEKLASMSKKVGYPDKWKDYSALVVGTNSYCENMMNAHAWHFNDMISKYGKPVDRTEWEMTPQTYNAYYNPSNNEIVLPAAIFTIPGIPDSLVDDAVVYGYAAASTIGHEITHGFDDEGRNFDAAGNLTDWWSPADADNFKVRAEVMVNQFSEYEPLPGKHINGKATLGENIADYGGILLGLEAFKRTEQFRKGEKIAGYTPLQRYFMGYALGWLYQQREETLAMRLMTDVHSPAKYRVNGPFANIPEFYQAFGIKENSPMWRPDSLRVSIW
ncbi:MAG: M13 family metallopeptidase [Bacteroidia bacterium]